MTKLRDTDYLYISSRLKALQKNMLTREKLGRLVSAHSGEDAVKILTENGWNAFDPNDLLALEGEIARQRQAAFYLLYRFSPDSKVIDLFRLKYDYHNIKALIKAETLGTSANDLLSSAGMIPPANLTAMVRDKEYASLEPVMRDAVVEASDLLARTGDSQLSDLLLDRAMAVQMLDLAQQTESDYLLGYVRLWVDAGNLRVLTRAALSGKGFDYLRRAIFPGGSIPPSRLTSEATAEQLRSWFGKGPLAQAAEAASEAIEQGASLAALDLACDNALMNYIRSSRLIPFGEAHVISYLLARESELVSVRIIMTGRSAGLTEEQILERLRMSYV